MTNSHSPSTGSLDSKKPLDVIRLIDSSGSMDHLVPTVIQTIQEYEEFLVSNMPDARLKRVLFDSSVTELDPEFGDPAVFGQERPIARHYRAGGGTYLYRYASHQLDQLLMRAHESGDKRRSLLVLTTDGQNEVPHSLENRYGAPRAERIRTELMPYVWRLAMGMQRTPTEREIDALVDDEVIRKSPVAFWYQGVGMSKSHHREQARAMGIPDQWFFHVPATRQGYENGERSIMDSSRSYSDTGDTVFFAAPARKPASQSPVANSPATPDPDPSSNSGSDSSSGLTQFGAVVKP